MVSHSPTIHELIPLSFLIHRLTHSQYRKLQDWLGLGNYENPRIIHTPLLEIVNTCLPIRAYSNHSYQIWQFQVMVCQHLPLDLQESLRKLIISNPEPLITAFANYPIPPSLISTPAPESSNCINSDLAEQLQSLTNQILHLPTVIL